MTLATLRSRALAGMSAPAVLVEVHLANGLPSFTNVVCQLDLGAGRSRPTLRGLPSSTNVGQATVGITAPPADPCLCLYV